MKAVIVKQPGGIEQLEIADHEKPKPQNNELLVKVKATALNRADLLQRQGKYPAPPGDSPLLGLEVAGIVEEAPAEGQWKQGDKVFSLLGGGGYAQYCVIPVGMAMRKPEKISFEEAASIPEAFLTAYQALVWLGGMSPTDRKTVLVHAGASGVGSAAIQLVKRFHPENKVIVTAGSQQKLAFCQQLGADFGANYKEQNWREEVAKFTNGKGVDILLDFIGAPYWEDNIASLGQDGVMIFLGSLGGTAVPKGFDMGPILRKRLQIKGSTLRSRSLEYKQQLTQDLAKFLLPKLESGEIHGVVDKVFDWREVRDAHQYMHDNKNIGKIVLNNINLD